jgi:peptidoglycan/xylan/chitin deacetylase (PgdA/CDA1 family)
MGSKMIGVLCNEIERDAVREFFELFKTPWEFVIPGREYDVVISTLAENDPLNGRLIILYSSKPAKIDALLGITVNQAALNQFVNVSGTQLPIYGNLAVMERGRSSLLRNSVDSGTVAIEVDTASNKMIRVGYDLFSEVAFIIREGQPIENALIPTLDIHISLLRGWMVSAGIPFVEIPPLPSGYPFFACLTHDIDYAGIRQHRFDRTMWGFVYRALIESLFPIFKGRFNFSKIIKNWMAVVKLPFVLAGVADDFWEHFDHYAEIDGGHGSTFFLIPFKNKAGDTTKGFVYHKRAAGYDIDDVAKQIKRLNDSGFEIGLHGIDAWHSAEKGRQELNRIAQATGRKEIGIRMHWLWFDDQSPRVLDQAGLNYDSSLGYNDRVGFKSGTVQVFKPGEVSNLLEIPLNIQDTALFYYRRMALSNAEARHSCTQLVHAALQFGGVLTVNWHDRSLEPDRLWGDFYTWLLQELRRHNAWVGSAYQVVEWFRCRRSITFGETGLTNNRFSIEINSKKPVIEPHMVLRFHISQPSVPSNSDIKDHYFDVPWNGETIVEIPLDKLGA